MKPTTEKIVNVQTIIDFIKALESCLPYDDTICVDVHHKHGIAHYQIQPKATKKVINRVKRMPMY